MYRWTAGSCWALVLGCWLAWGLAEPDRCAAGWQAGVARRAITPQQSMWMSGYGSRDQPSQGKLTELWAKVLVLDDGQGERAVCVTLDLVGIDRQFSTALCRRIEAAHHLQRRQVALCCSHTHTGPVVGDNLMAMYFLDDEQKQRVRDYTGKLGDMLVELVGQALADVEPCELRWATGQATFAVNRRNNAEAEVPRLRAEGTLRGPVDYDVPVLAVWRQPGELKAVLFGYACHATVLSSYEWSGDYPGFAQMALEASHPGATALFFAGCGADQNPIPRRDAALARQYGEALAAAVDRTLAGVMQPIEGRLASEYREIELPFATLPTREALEQQRASGDRFVASRARRLLAQIDGGEPLSPVYPYPIECWRLGDQLTLLLLGGEVVVDYALELKRRHGPALWVAAYANDVMAYIPSRRVLAEGGYEGGGAMVYYGLPTVWAPEVEARLLAAADALLAPGDK